jgi:dihydrofolate reductase
LEDDMGKLVVTEFITVDGVIDSPGELGWVFKFNRGDEGDKFKFDELMSADAQLLGRITYQGFAQAWPSMGTDPFGARMNRMPKFVVSNEEDSRRRRRAEPQPRSTQV